MKQVPRVPSSGRDVLKDTSRSQQHSPCSETSEASLKVELRSREEAVFKDMSRSIRRPLSDSSNVCHDNQDSVTIHQQRRHLHPLCARRRSSCVSFPYLFTDILKFCLLFCNFENGAFSQLLYELVVSERSYSIRIFRILY